MSSVRTLPFVKIVGTGNDFLFIDLRDEPLHSFTSLSKPNLVARLAHRQTGVGADGIVFVERSAAGPPLLKWDFFNSDGSSASMCGNALRCMGRWGAQVLSQNETTFETVRGLVTVRRIGEEFYATLDFLRFQPKEIRYGADRAKTAVLLDTGVPHMVVTVADTDQVGNLTTDIQALRFHPEAGAEGANVTFLQIVSPNQFRTVTFERGVEGFTLSCGTGVLAAAAVGLGISQNHLPQKAVEARLSAPGGDLRVVFETSLRATTLIGPAEIVFFGHAEKGILK